MSSQTSNDTFHRVDPVEIRHDSRYGASFQEWLRCQLEGFSRSANRSMALDVGAHQGEFFKNLLREGLVTELTMFEPHPGNAGQLRQAFDGDIRVVVEEMAVASSSGTAEFAFGEDSATGSLLQPTGCSPAANRINQVPVTRLDDYASQRGILDRINILKIDTQGADLQVLEGSVELLRASRPVLVLEMIFAPLYENQSSPMALFSWLEAHDYAMAGVFDEHYSRQGWLAWCDACFLPRSRMIPYQEPFSTRRSPEVSGKRKRPGLIARILGKI